MKVSKNFDLREFVPPTIWERFKENSIWFIDQRVIDLAQFYRDYFDKPVTVNNWHYNPGGYSERGFRVPTTITGAKLSQHRFGRAFDCNIDGITPNEAREEILKNREMFMAHGLTTLESGEFAKTWIHSDIRATNLSRILIVGK